MAATGPEYGGFYTAERIANLRANVEKYPWAKSEQVGAISGAAFWVKKSDDELWRMVPGQDLPRCIDAHAQDWVRTGGCPNCGPVIYDTDKYPYQVDIWGHPWQIQCPRCKDWFPKNDFGKYYQSGIDETGVFNPRQADRSLLFNTDHPDANDPKHMWCVDDGYGWNPDKDHVNRFVAYYVWRYWGAIKGGTAALARAYLYTGDPIYAHKCAVLMDRISDVYPSMDWSVYGKQGWPHSGSQDGGKIEGSIWEVETAMTLATAYDMVKSGLWNQPELCQFLVQKSQQYQLPTAKGDYDKLVGNIETNLIAEFMKAVQSGRKIYGNEGNPQQIAITCAVALNREPTSEEWIDWAFKEGTVGQGALRPGEGGHIPALLVAAIDRDGVGAEGSPGYSLGWGAALGQAADMLADYGKSKHDLYKDYPQFKQTILAGWNLAMLATTTPNIGDAGGCGSRHGIIAADPSFIVRGYKYLKDPRYALIAGWANHGQAGTIGRDIYAKDPDWIARDVARLLDEHGHEPPIAGLNRAGYGLVSVQFGPRDTGQALWMYYGLNGVAGHKSELMYGYDAFGFTVVPTLGYRELWGSWPKSAQWEDATISHNTVMVDQNEQSTIRVGSPEFFAQFPDFGGFAVDSREAYPGVAQQYSRTMALVKVGDQNASYAVDIMRVHGGKDHLLTFHALPGTVTTEGLRLVEQAGGSYAGPDIPYGTSMAPPRMGTSWLKNVARDSNPAGQFLLDYQGQAPYWTLQDSDDVHVRYHCFTRYDDVALADGYPPQGQSNPEKLRFLLCHRAGQDLNTTNVALIEPYQKQPLIKQVTRLKINGQDANSEAVALRVELADGAVDHITAGADDTTVYQTEDGVTFSGRLQGLRRREGKIEKAWIVRGSKLAMGKFALSLPDAGYRGTIVKMDRGMKDHCCVWVKEPLPVGEVLRGSEIIIANDRRSPASARLNACYTVDNVQKDGDLYKVDCGDVCFIRGFVDLKDYSKGYVYNFEEGAEWIIPTKARLALGPNQTAAIAANAKMEVNLPQ
jgi:hypothetical protein